MQLLSATAKPIGQPVDTAGADGCDSTDSALLLSDVAIHFSARGEMAGSIGLRGLSVSYGS